MIRKLFLLLIIFFTSFNLSISQQYKRQPDEKSKSKIAMGVNGGLAYLNDNSGFNAGLFVEINTENFSLVPQANYWKVNENSNFELAGLVRLRFKSTSLEPYVDGGLGVNFYAPDSKSNLQTKIGIDLGGGLDLIGLGENFSVFFDGKYKIIVSDPNIKGYILSGGIKLNL